MLSYINDASPSQRSSRIRGLFFGIVGLALIIVGVVLGSKKDSPQKDPSQKDPSQKDPPQKDSPQKDPSQKDIVTSPPPESKVDDSKKASSASDISTVANQDTNTTNDVSTITGKLSDDPTIDCDIVNCDFAKNRDCQYSDWKYGECERQPDNTYIKVGTRYIISASLGNGKPCPGTTRGNEQGISPSTLIDKTSPSTICEKIDCQLDDEWTQTGQCSTTCGAGTIIGIKNIKIQPQYGGKACPDTYSPSRYKPDIPCVGTECRGAYISSGTCRQKSDTTCVGEQDQIWTKIPGSTGPLFNPPSGPVSPTVSPCIVDNCSVKEEESCSRSSVSTECQITDCDTDLFSGTRTVTSTLDPSSSASCPGDTIVTTVQCTASPTVSETQCSRDCIFSPGGWTEWSQCTGCGEQTQTRTLTIQTPERLNGTCIPPNTGDAERYGNMFKETRTCTNTCVSCGEPVSTVTTVGECPQNGDNAGIQNTMINTIYNNYTYTRLMGYIYL